MEPPLPLDPTQATKTLDLSRLKPRFGQIAAVVIVALFIAIALKPSTRNSYLELAGETLFVGMVVLLAFNVARAWRQRWLPGWVAQLLAVTLGGMLAPLIVQLITVGGDISVFLNSRARVGGYWMVATNAIIFGALFALGALYRERDAQARAQALQFALERETLKRQAADAQLRLLTAQIEPHFLLNTLANVQELIEGGSPKAVPVFRSLIAYLRAAMPQLQHEDATLGDEERLVQSYLELMLMRMPDRLSYQLLIDPSLRQRRFPPMTLLTLVENAIRHGIDPAVVGGSITIGAAAPSANTLHLWVADTGVGMSDRAVPGLGLSNLESRLKAFFGTGTRLELSDVAPHGLRADIHLDLAAQGG
jgi:hypothetical protein